MLDTIRFYNGQSSPFQQRFIYTKPDVDFKEENGTAYWVVDAPPKTFFTVPFEIETNGGTWRISIHREITERFGDRGIVRVDANAKQALIDNPNDQRFAYVAADDESAKVKGTELWKLYLRTIIDNFEAENNRRVTERGITPLRPNNYVAHAYKELGLEVPGDERFIKAGLQKTDVSELQQTVLKQQKQIEQLLALHMPASTLQVAAAIAPESEAAGEPEAVTVGAQAEKHKGKNK